MVKVSASHDDFPALLAEALDMLAAWDAGLKPAAAAQSLPARPGQFSKVQVQINVRATCSEVVGFLSVAHQPGGYFAMSFSSFRARTLTLLQAGLAGRSISSPGLKGLGTPF
jgi:hypothetical protein